MNKLHKTLKIFNVVSILVFFITLSSWLLLIKDFSKANNSLPLKVTVKGVRQERMGANNQGTDNSVSQQSNKQKRVNGSILESSFDFDKEVNVLRYDNKMPKVKEPFKEDEVGSPYVRAKSAVAIDVGTEKILYNQNAQNKRPIASLTKLITALVVLDKVKDLNNEVVTIDQEVCHTPTSKIGCPSSTYCISDVLKEGEQVRAGDLLEAMLVNSANDAAVALGKHIAGSQENFAKLMNKKAAEIGLKNTHFCNPSGLDDEESAKHCYSSAEDVAKIVVYALKNKNRYGRLNDIFKIKEKWFSSVDGKMKHKFTTTNILLSTMPNCLGAKTGFTYEAGKTLATWAESPQNKSIKVVVVILDDPHRFDDAKYLFDWIFKNYNWK